MKRTKAVVCALLACCLCWSGAAALAATAGARTAKAAPATPAAPIVPAAGAPAPAAVTEEAATAYGQGDFVKARALWEELAKQGDAKAMNNLGVLYDRGQGVPEDAAQAVQWFRQAAEKGHGPGMSNYGRMLEQGRGLPRDVDQAMHWFREAADRNVADAQFNLGVLYERGEGVPASDRDAAAWYSRAAANQQVNAQARLGQFYRDGRGVDKNATRAVLLLYGAAMEGHSGAVHDLETLAGEERRGKPDAKASVFGVELVGATRGAMRAALSRSAVPATREDNAFICDVYNVRKAIPGATEMAACYGPGTDVGAQPLGFIKIDYPATDKKHAGRVRSMVEGRFGAASAGEGADGALWNLGTVIVATQYVPESRQVGLMYMVPRVYHLTRKVPPPGEK